MRPEEETRGSRVLEWRKEIKRTGVQRSMKDVNGGRPMESGSPTKTKVTSDYKCSGVVGETGKWER